MTKLDKTDLDNIKLILKETKISNISNFKIKKGNYEIEISSSNLKPITEIGQKIEEQSENKNNTKLDELTNEENIVKSPMVGVAYLSADPN